MSSKLLSVPLLVSALVVSMGAPVQPAQVAQASQPLNVDRARLETIEDQTESLANDLLEMSVALRRLNITEAGSYFADEVDANRFPQERTRLREAAPGITLHQWSIGEGSPRVSREELLASLASFLSLFPEIEDLRFKVKASQLENGAEAQARLFFFLVGRNQVGDREWVRGYVNVVAVLPPESDQWQMQRFHFESLDSLVSEGDLFSEVTATAGLWEDVPRFGEPPNDGFLAHGVAVGDLNNNGALDLVTTGVLGNRLFLTDPSGDRVAFEDVSESSLIRYSRDGTGVLVLDYDNDGDQDIFMAALGEQILLQNQLRPTGELVFVDVSLQTGLHKPAVGFSAVSADVNNDGWSDIYVCSYNRYGQAMPNSWSKASNGTPNLLFVSDGEGGFDEVADIWGVADERWSYAAAFADVDGDGRQDLYVANDFGENALFMNRGDHFVDEALERGVLDPGNGMGVSFGDFDNDGDLDLHVTNMSSTAGNRILLRLMPEAQAGESVLKKLAAGNSLFENLGEGHYRDVSANAGPFSAGWAFGGGFFDYDNDGWEDTFSVNGFVSGKTMDDT